MSDIVFKEIHSDSRRCIYSNSDLLGGTEISMIKLHNGKAIGGCWHTKDEYFIVWKGKMEVITRGDFGELRRIYTAGEGGVFPKGVSHAMVALEDCLASEWGITPEEKCLDQKDPILRAEVDAINNRTT